ncbi:MULTISPECIES: DUF6328 family protein [unclassified Kribbella]|uniref:DUF6328 family protein n=1 Tax=unclassified Kribbella TaxID=2644121 RepID=UPI0030197C4F
MTEPEARYDRDGEDEAKKLDRHWNELLQELRLAQTGTQILFAFLLSIAFQAKFQEADTFTHDVYAGTLIASALAVGLFLAPVSFHRLVYRQKLRDRMLPIAGHMTSAGLVFLIIAMAGGVQLALDVVLPRSLAIVIAALVLAWFAVFWYVIPAWVRANSNEE